MSVSERNKFKLPILDSDGWLTPEDVARVLPNTSAKSVRDWCAAGKLAGAVQCRTSAGRSLGLLL